MRSREDHDHALAIVRDIVHSWDLLSLRAGGAPADERDREIASLVAQVPRDRLACRRRSRRVSCL